MTDNQAGDDRVSLMSNVIIPDYTKLTSGNKVFNTSRQKNKLIFYAHKINLKLLAINA